MLENGWCSWEFDSAMLRHQSIKQWWRKSTNDISFPVRCLTTRWLLIRRTLIWIKSNLQKKKDKKNVTFDAMEYQESRSQECITQFSCLKWNETENEPHSHTSCTWTYNFIHYRESPLLQSPKCSHTVTQTSDDAR